MFLNPMDRHDRYSHDDEYTEYVAVDIGSLLNFEQLTALIQQAAAKLPASQQLKAGENWGYYIQVHTKDRTAVANIVRPYPYKTWAW